MRLPEGVEGGEERVKTDNSGRFGITGALPAMTQPLLLLAGIGVGICSSVIPYVSDQLAMARLPRATFALLLSLLPASAALIGILVLR